MDFIKHIFAYGYFNIVWGLVLIFTQDYELAKINILLGIYFAIISTKDYPK